MQITGISGDTITFEATIDETNYGAVQARNLSTQAIATTATANGLYRMNIVGYKAVRARISTYGAGTIYVHGILSAEGETGHFVMAGTGAVTATVSLPSTIYNGKKTVTTAGTRVTLASSQAITSGVTIKALSTNTGVIYVGDSSVSSSNGYQLAAGDSVFLEIANLSTVNLDSSVNGEGVTYLAG